MKEYYNNIYSKRKGEQGQPDPPVRMLRSKINIYSRDLNLTGAKILDVAGGTGNKLEIFSGMNDLYLVDISEIALKEASKKGIKTYCLNLEEEDLPFKDNTFDLAICTEVIEHIYNYRHLLAEIKRVLNKHGYLILTTPNLTSLSGRITMLFGFPPTSLLWDESHVRFFRFSDLKGLIEEEGFKIIKSETSGVYLNTPKIGFIKIPFLDKFLKNLGEHIILLCKSINGEAKNALER